MVRKLLLILIFVGICLLNKLDAQQRCFTTEYYDSLNKKIPGFKALFEANQKRLLSNRFNALKVTGTNDTVAVVVHIIVNAIAQTKITDADIQSQIDVLNEDYWAANADSTRIPVSFKPLFGKMKLTFMLAQTDPNGDLTNGIERRTNSITFDPNTFDNAKQYSKGGLDAWDPTKYINLWVIDFGFTGVLGVSVFPGDPRPLNLHGVVCDYRAFGRTGTYLYSEFNRGRTISHELGHFFNLRHIWGDDNGDCTGTDFPNAAPGDDDTPNQADFTRGNPDTFGVGKIVTDICSQTNPGIMYQNYMDYTDDSALVMFTNGQINRMQTGLTSPDRAPLLNSIAFRPPFIYTYDARLKSVINPAFNSTLCSPQFSSKIIVRNQGSSTLTSVVINVDLNGNVQSVPYPIRLDFGKDTTLSLPLLTAATGINQIKIYTSLPDGNQDQNVTNDTITSTFKFLSTLSLTSSYIQDFSVNIFPPANWDIRNPDNDMTWKWNSLYGANGAGSAWFNDYNNATNNLFDDLVMPNFSYQNKDSIFLKFNFASAVYSNPNTTTIPIDTMTILISKDCGNSFTTVYKKWGKDLNTTGSPNGYTVEFFPNIFQWRADSVNLGKWLSNTESSFQISFRFSGNYENNYFLDDVNLYTKTVPQRLKDQGYLIYPTVFSNQVNIWFYQQPTDVQFINVYNSVGQLIWQRNFSGNADKLIPVDLTGKSAGEYFVHIGYSDNSKKIVQKIIKQN